MAVDAHEVQRHVPLLRRKGRERQRLFRVAVVPRRIDPVRDVVSDHPVLNPLLITLVQVVQDHLPHRLDRPPPILRQRRQVRLHSRRCRFSSSYSALNVGGRDNSLSLCKARRGHAPALGREIRLSHHGQLRPWPSYHIRTVRMYPASPMQACGRIHHACGAMEWLRCTLRSDDITVNSIGLLTHCERCDHEHCRNPSTRRSLEPLARAEVLPGWFRTPRSCPAPPEPDRKS